MPAPPRYHIQGRVPPPGPADHGPCLPCAAAPAPVGTSAPGIRMPAWAVMLGCPVSSKPLHILHQRQIFSTKLRASAPADPEVVDGQEAGLVSDIDPSLPGLYEIVCLSVLAD